MRNRKNLRKGERGQVLPFVAISFTMILALCALAIDLGIAHHQQRVAQNIADAAAIAGANQLSYTSSLSNITSVASHDAKLNGLGPGTLKITNPPVSSINNNGNSNAVEAEVTMRSPGFFGSSAGIQSWTVHAQAVAVGAPSLPCMDAISPTAMFGPESFQVNAKTQLDLPNCDIASAGGILVNGSGAADPTFINSSSLSYVTTISNPLSTSNATSAQGYPAAQKIGSLADPCTQAPTSSVCGTFPNFATKCPGAVQNGTIALSNGQNKSIPAGHYSVIDLNVGGNQNAVGNATATFGPGTFCIDGFFDTYITTLNAAPGTSFYIKGPVAISSISLNFPSAVVGEPLIYTLAPSSAFSINLQPPPNTPSNDTLGGMIYAPNGNITFAAGSYGIQSVIGANITFNTNAGAVKVKQLNATSTSTTLAE